MTTRPRSLHPHSAPNVSAMSTAALRLLNMCSDDVNNNEEQEQRRGDAKQDGFRLKLTRGGGSKKKNAHDDDHPCGDGGNLMSHIGDLCPALLLAQQGANAKQQQQQQQEAAGSPDAVGVKRIPQFLVQDCLSVSPDQFRCDGIYHAQSDVPEDKGGKSIDATSIFLQRCCHCTQLFVACHLNMLPPCQGTQGKTKKEADGTSTTSPLYYCPKCHQTQHVSSGLSSVSSAATPPPRCSPLNKGVAKCPGCQERLFLDDTPSSAAAPPADASSVACWRCGVQVLPTQWRSTGLVQSLDALSEHVPPGRAETIERLCSERFQEYADTLVPRSSNGVVARAKQRRDDAEMKKKGEEKQEEKGEKGEGDVTLHDIAASAFITLPANGRGISTEYDNRFHLTVILLTVRITEGTDAIELCASVFSIALKESSTGGAFTTAQAKQIICVKAASVRDSSRLPRFRTSEEQGESKTESDSETDDDDDETTPNNSKNNAASASVPQHKRSALWLSTCQYTVRVEEKSEGASWLLAGGGASGAGSVGGAKGAGGGASGGSGTTSSDAAGGGVLGTSMGGGSALGSSSSDGNVSAQMRRHFAQQHEKLVGCVGHIVQNVNRNEFADVFSSIATSKCERIIKNSLGPKSAGSSRVRLSFDGSRQVKIS